MGILPTMTFEPSPGTATPLVDFGAQSMTAPLRDVLVQRPGPAFGAAFDDPAHGFLHPVSLDVARREHDAFTDLLANNYIRRIQSGFRNEKVVFTGEEVVTNTKAVVRTKIVREGGEIPVDYSLKAEGAGWRIYDINIEGVSLVQNYRSQFSQILLKESPDQLIERVRKKNKEEEGKK